MRKFILSKVPLILVIIAFAIFNVIYWPVVGPHISKLHAGAWIAYGFMCAGFAITGALTFIRLRSKTNFTATLPVFFADVGYLVVAAIFNVIAFIVSIKSPEWIYVLVVNAVLLLLFLGALLMAYKSFARVEDNTARRTQKVRQFRTYAIEIGSLKDLTEDPEIIAELDKLQEDVNYSSTAGNSATAEKEVMFGEKIEELNSLLSAGADKEEVMKGIKDAQRILKVRNQLLMANK